MTKNKNQDELVFLPLGGSGEIGMNLNMFGFGPEHNRKWIIVDIGVTFGNADTPGVDIIMPNIDFIEQNRKDILGIILTHAHEDHMGALARLWDRIRCPVWATPFTMYLVKDRLAEVGLLDDVPLNMVELGGKIEIGPFDIDLITLTHSIPEPNALAIRTPLGTILHTGDWKIDANPQIGEPVDEKALRALGDEGVLTMICDSTNVFSPGEAGSEEGVREELIKLIGEYKGKGIAVASFASNVARMESVMMAAKANNRSVCLMGRSMKRMTAAAKSIGLLSETGVLLSEDEAQAMSPGNVLYLCTGSQGEPRAALSRIAHGEHRTLKFKKGDVVVFSSKIIPGNEKGIFALQNALADDGVEIITEKMRDIHVSGHPCRDELARMYEWVRPQTAVPVHGERRHLLEHAKLAKTFGVKRTYAPRNGEMILLAPQGPEVIDIVASGRLHQDGKDIVGATDDGLRLRRKMAYAGHVSVSLVVDHKGKLISGPEPRVSGFPEGHKGKLMDQLLDAIADSAEAAFNSLAPRAKKDEDAIEDRVSAKVKRLVRDRTGKRALVEVVAHKVK
ncbi:MBL fold hydrolase [Litorimonas cladophorae]|uniref:MBL fold hydrolase n=1 Tax=Litorimonas cladophorae TaxID=1220491 RepID=A0A918KDK1_9PROT|nr:ribonuclease J [Litorimonas cladophorae]GGX57590.1 MBL fold hydrolase [Litorimonas cladophorae]